MGYNSEAPYAVGLMVGTNCGSVMHKIGFLGGDPWLLMNLNKYTTRFLVFVSSANKPVPCWRGLCKEEREENAALCSQSHQTRSAVAPAGAPAGSQVQKTGACLWLCFPKEEKGRFSHPRSSLGIEFRSFWKEDLVFAMFLPPLPHVQDPGPWD